MKCCILGGGATGIGIGKHLKQHHIDFDIYEREDEFGGNWYAGKSCSKMYKTVHLISSKLNTQFSDVPMPAEWPSYPHHTLMLKYLRHVAEKYRLYENARFNKNITSVKRKNNQWVVEASSGEKENYDVLIVANGLYRKPHLPHYAGSFQGEIFHSIAYRSPEQIYNKNVLVVGAGNTGCDIAVEATYYAKSIFHSLRRGYYFMPRFIAGLPTQEWLMSITNQFKNSESYWEYVKDIFKLIAYDPTDYGLPKPNYEIYQCHPTINSVILNHYGQGDIIYKPDIKFLDNQHIEFLDNSREKIDTIIYATGYEPDFSFLPKELYDNNQNLNLFLHTFHRKYDDLLFVGYVNAPSGIGNLVNAGGKLLVAYIKALMNNSPSIDVFRQLKKGENPDLGNSMFIKTRRHAYELDLWRLIKAMNSLTQKFEQG